jgi:hypothetical protein
MEGDKYKKAINEFIEVLKDDIKKEIIVGRGKASSRAKKS